MTAVYSHNRLLYSRENEQGTSTCLDFKKSRKREKKKEKNFRRIDQKGLGPRKALQPQEAVTSTKTALPASQCGVRDVGPTCLPSRPAGLSEVWAGKNSREEQDRGQGGDKKIFSNLASKQSKFKETKP